MNAPLPADSPVILLVDDSPEILFVMSDLLAPSYCVRVAINGRRALEIAGQSSQPDLILLDVMMPEMDGYAVLSGLKANPQTRDIPVIFITAMGSTEDEEKGLELGAVDYITKPIRPSIMLARVHAQLELKRARDWLQNQNDFLDAEVARRMSENQTIQDASIHALGHLAEIRDPETGNHLRRTQEYVRLLGEALKTHPRFAAALSDRAVALLAKSAPLHDIGKVGIPDQILLKPGRLEPAEFEVMKTHAKIGAEAIEQAEHDVGQPIEFLAMAKEIAHWHHEHWDGKGYPDGLRGEQIPVAARLMALADVFDALTNVRVYKEAMSFEQARDIIVAGRGSHFDPDVVDAFLKDYPAFIEVAERYREGDALKAVPVQPGTDNR